MNATATATDFHDVTEMAGEPITSEQLDRLCHRYFWAAEYCHEKDVVELACGTGPGLGLLAHTARSLEAGDYSDLMVQRVHRYYGDRVPVSRFDAGQMPYEAQSRDVIILFEALYYLSDVDAFIRECRRVLRPGGKVLIATANKDLADFNPSPHSHRYLGVTEFDREFGLHGLNVRCYGYLDVGTLSLRQKILRPVKKAVVAFGLMPKTMRGKQILKKIVFGTPVPMPAEINESMRPADVIGSAILLPAGVADTRHKVIYCEATIG